MEMISYGFRQEVFPHSDLFSIAASAATRAASVVLPALEGLVEEVPVLGIHSSVQMGERMERMEILVISQAEEPVRGVSRRTSPL